jgi:hypothetical protein
VLLRPAAAAALALIAAGCGGGGKPEPTTSLAPGCEVDRIAKIVNGFLGAVNAGDQARLARFVSVSPSYLIHDGAGAKERRVHLTRRSGVLRYFAERHRLRERERMISLRVAPGIDANHVLIDFRLTRTAADFPRRGITGRLAGATARVNCVTDRVERLLIRGP